MDSGFGTDVLGLSSLPGPLDWAPAGTTGSIGDVATGGGTDVPVAPPAAAPAGSGGPGAPNLAQLLGAAPPGGVLGPNTGRVMSALGAGLSSAGQNWNKPAAAAFASGAGAALQGGQSYDNAVQSLKLKALQAAIAAWKVGDIAAYHRALTNFRAASAQQRQPAASAPSPAVPTPPVSSPANNPPAPPASVTKIASGPTVEWSPASSVGSATATSDASAARPATLDVIAQARDAIARGAPPDAVRQRALDHGYVLPGL